MSFWGNSFSYNGIPCEDFDLMIYDIDNNTQGNAKFASTVSIIEDKVSTRWKPLFYGTQYENKLSFSLIFGVSPKRIELSKFLDRYEMEAIGSWLTGQNEYHWLEIRQDDLEYVRYKCIITSLEMIEFGRVPHALKATVECDSPYAYMYPQVFEYTLTEEEKEIEFYNESSHNGFYMPMFQIIKENTISPLSLSIKNITDSGREFLLGINESVPTSIEEIIVNNDLCIIDNDEGINIYPCFNFNFFRLKRGINRLIIKGSGKLKIICEFPVNVGG